MDLLGNKQENKQEEKGISSKEKLEVWLSENGLLKYANAFHRNHITYDMLGSLNDEDIDNLEMHNDADINRFRKAISGLNKMNSLDNGDSQEKKQTVVNIPRSNSFTGRDIASSTRHKHSSSFTTDGGLSTSLPRHYETVRERNGSYSNTYKYSNSVHSPRMDTSYSLSVNEMFSHTMNSHVSQEIDYNLSVSSQGEMNRYIAADSFVNDVLPGVGIENKPSEKKLVARNWTEENGIYARAHPEDAEDIHMICEYLYKGLVILNNDSSFHSIKEILEDIILQYNTFRSVDTHIHIKELLDNNNYIYHNGFLVLKSISKDYAMNDIIFTRLHQRSVIVDHNDEQIKYIFILIGTDETINWSNNTFSLFEKIIHDDTLYNDLFQAKSKEDIIQCLSDMAVRIQLPKKPKLKKPKKKPIFTDFKKDVKTRWKWYASDFSDGYTVNTILKTLLVFVSQLGPALIFAVLISKYSHGNISMVETLLGQAIALLVWALFGGQPMILMGLTGPIAIYVEVLYQLATSYNLPFFVLYEWVGIWSAFFLMLIVAFNKAEIFAPITEFTKRIFSSLTSVLFIMEVYKYIKKYYTYASNNDGHYNWETFFFVCLVLIGTVLLMDFFTAIRNTTFLYQSFRIFFRLASQLITILLVYFIVHSLFPFIDYSRFDIPSWDSFHPSYVERPWFINPFRYHPSLAVNDWKSTPDTTNMTCPYSTELLSSVSSCTFPWWAIFIAMILAIPYTILVYLEDNITSGLIERPEHNLKKGGPYDYLDTTVTAFLTFLLSLFGLPWVSALYIRSIHHMQALSVIEDIYKPYGSFEEHFIQVNENRISGIVLSILFFCIFFFNNILSDIPESVYYGLLLYMGINLFISQGLFKGLKLLFMDRSLYVNDVRNNLSLTRINIYTVIQVVLLLVLIILKSSAGTAVLFPIGLLFLIFIRKYLLPRIFTKQELNILDPIVHHHNYLIVC